MLDAGNLIWQNMSGIKIQIIRKDNVSIIFPVLYYTRYYMIRIITKLL